MTDRHAGLSDADLVILCRQGQDRAFGAIVARYKQPLHRVVAGLTGDADEAVDIVQDAFVAAHAALGRFDTRRPLRAWLMRIAVNKARDWRRRRIVRRFVAALLPADATAIADDAPAIDRAVADRAELTRVDAAIARLPAALREVIVLRTIDGRGQAETAAMLGVSQKTVETRLYRARRLLSATIAGDNGERP